MTTQVDQNREDEDGRISQDTATPTAGTNQADNLLEILKRYQGLWSHESTAMTMHEASRLLTELIDLVKENPDDK